MTVTNLFFNTGLAWGFTLLVSYVLFKKTFKNKNPMEWSLTDRCLFFFSIYFLFAGGFTLVMGLMKFYPPERFPYINWKGMDHLYAIYNLFILIAVFLVIIGFWLRNQHVERSFFGHITIQFSAIFMAFCSYGLGPATHPGPMLLAMALGAFNLIIFGLKFTVSWMITFILLFFFSVIVIWLDLFPYSYGGSPPFINGKIDGFYLFGTSIFVAIIFLLMLSTIAYIFVLWRDREKKVAEMSGLLKKMFGRYLSPEVMNSIIDNPSALELGGERRKITIMMTDLRGFTAMSERLEPEQVVQMLNGYFEIMMEVVLRYNGTINEIIGDALLIIFGAPQEMSNRAEQAIACAIEMQNAMTEVNERNRAQGLPELEMGIGLNETEVIVGNIGSAKRSKYAVVGSGVNMTSRIESYTVGGQILISESVRKEAGDILRIDGQREVLPKGTEAPLMIYEIGGIAGSYKLALEREDSDLVALTQKVPLRYTILEGKHVGKIGLEGFVVKLSKKSAKIVLDEPVEQFTNLKMNLKEVYEELAVKDFYGKVIELLGEDGHSYMIRFTSVPPEVVSYFLAHQQYATKDAIS